jgi:hypothetical protein
MHSGDETMNMAFRAPGREIRAASARLPVIFLAFVCLGLASGAAAAQARVHSLIASDAVFSPAPELGMAGHWSHLVAEQASDEQAELPPGARVTREQAASIALKVIAGEVTSVDVERKLGRIVYTVEIMTPGGDETDVFVDVETGEVVGTD